MNISILIRQPQILLLVLSPVFFICMFVEYFWGIRRKKLQSNAQYCIAEVICNFTLAGLYLVTDALTGILISHLYLSLFSWRMFDINMTTGTILLLIVTQDFLYYWFHRASHKIRWMWAAHVVHHSSKNMNFTVAFRQSLMYPVAGMWLFWIPLVIIGFDPHWVILSVLINLGYQFFPHTQIVKKLGWFELILNTPSHHRVHHGINHQYIDRNFAGIFIIWDRLFGTFVPERETVRYGVSRPVNSFNPVKVSFIEWIDMFSDAIKKNIGWKKRLKVLFAPPSNYKH